MKRRPLVLVLLPVLALAGLAAACGDGPDPAPTPVATSATAPKQAATSPTAAKGAIKLENPTVLPDGLQYTDQVVGTGASPRIDQQVTVHYTGKLASNGKVFDSSVGGQPITFGMGGVIKGFSEGLSTMKVGGKRTVFIPSALGYGASGTPGGPVPPNADLIFEIELIAIK
jgi:peptidylprolyl isomerase